MGRRFTGRLDGSIVRTGLGSLMDLRGGPVLHLMPLRVGAPFLLTKAALKKESVATVCSGIKVVQVPRRCQGCVREFKLFTDASDLRLYSYSFKSRVILDFASGVPGKGVRQGFIRELGGRRMSYAVHRGSLPKRGRRRGRRVGLFRDFAFLYVILTIMYGLVSCLLSNRVN